MDRQKKLIIVGATGLFLLIAIIVLIVLAVRGNKQPVEPEPTPIETIEPTATPTEAPTPTLEPTPTATPAEPGQPELPGETITPTVSPSPTPVEAGSPELPESTTTSTPKPTQTATSTPKPVTPIPVMEIEIKAAANTISFGLPKNAYVGAIIMVTVPTNAGSLTWSVSKDGVVLPFSEACSGSLSDAGGMIAFSVEGEYALTATAAGGGTHSARIDVKKRS